MFQLATTRIFPASIPGGFWPPGLPLTNLTIDQVSDTMDRDDSGNSANLIFQDVWAAVSK